MRAFVSYGPNLSGMLRLQASAVPAVYKPLFSVALRHAYYNAAHWRCPDFRVIPTPDCVALMARLGLVFRDQGTGFTVYVNQADIGRLAYYLRPDKNKPGSGAGLWTWLTFLLVAVNPGFVGITRLPISTSPGQSNLYICNSNAHAVNGQYNLARGAFAGADALLPVTGAGVSVRVPQGGGFVVTDISGSAVVPANGAALRQQLAEDTQSYTDIVIDISNLPYGRYTVAATGAGAAPARTLLFVPTQPRPLCVVDILLTQPTPGGSARGKYPVPSEADPAPAAVGDITYTLPFNARRTYWRYYVVSQSPDDQFSSDLQISGKGAVFEKSSAVLPTGQQAVLFTATTPLSLRQKPEKRFQLTGSRNGPHGHSNPIRITQLSGPPLVPVWPAPKPEPLSGTSEMFVYV
jgi:hypothetical protein